MKSLQSSKDPQSHRGSLRHPDVTHATRIGPEVLGQSEAPGAIARDPNSLKKTSSATIVAKQDTRVVNASNRRNRMREAQAPPLRRAREAHLAKSQKTPSRRYFRFGSVRKGPQEGEENGSHCHRH
jgi:hypothetical protein